MLERPTIPTSCSRRFDRSQFKLAAALHPETVPITYVEADGTEKQVEAELGMNLMEVAHANNVELEGTKRKHPLKSSEFA